MSFKKVQSSTISMLIAALFILGVGTYTDNGGFQLAGGIFLVVVLILALNQAQGKSDSS